MTKPYELKITEPTKVGEGMGAYITYQIIFKGLGHPFSNALYNVTRRFSDFLGLHDKLVSRHLSSGIIIPHPPEKHLLGTTKVKMSKDALIENEFVERRRVALERFLCKLLDHPTLRDDPDFREFLEYHGELPRSLNTQLLSGASAKKIIKNFGDVIGKMAHKIDDPDDYFDLKADELDSWEKQLKRVHGAFSQLVVSSQELVTSKQAVSRSISHLASVEMHSGLAHALGSLASAEEEVSHQYSVLAESELIYMVDCAHETLGMIQACKNALAERTRIMRVWKNAESALNIKQEQKSRLEMQGRTDQRKFITDVEIEELSKRCAADKKQFETISQTIKCELERINVDRFYAFTQSATRFLESVLEIHVKLLQVWETYTKRAKTIN